MSNKPKYPRSDALAVAAELTAQLRPFVERIEVAGSLRRGKPEVGDVELLFIPRISWKALQIEMYGEVDCDPMDEANAALNRMLYLDKGIIMKREAKNGSTAWGPKNKLAVHAASGIPVDFFATDALCWWNALVVRTGGRDSNVAVASAAHWRGWAFEAYGAGFHKLGDPAERHDTTSERDVFEFAGVKWLEPEDRP